MKTPAKISVHYVLSSHWDREWYQTFQDYRRRLVRLLDRVLDDLSAGTLHGPFTSDGQAIVLEDYLEIRPERREQVREFVRTGRLKVGPWYVLPDEWLVSGESIVRNLRLGRQIARDFGGEPSDVAFVCDLFGHISQLPQIARHFGIEVGLLWRGLEPRSRAHVRWRGADGTELICYRFGRAGYCDYSWDVRRCFEPGVAFEPSRARADLAVFTAKEAARSPGGPVLLFDGGDHLEYDADHYQLLFAPAADDASLYEFRHSTLDEYFADVRRRLDPATFELVTGELREPGRLPGVEEQQLLIPGVLSSRVGLKQANAECQTLLCHWAEPFSALATMLTDAVLPPRYFDLAWRWLLQNHPHDSICGCSIDAVHRDMAFRFAQCRQIAVGQLDDALVALAAAVEGDLNDRELRVLVANPVARERDEPVQLTLSIPAGWGAFQEFMGYEPKPAFRLFEANGRELPYQLLAQAPGRTKVRVQPLKFPETYKTTDVTVAVRLHLPALGYAVLTVREGAWREKSGPIAAAVLPVRHPIRPGLATSERTMENEHLAVNIASDGTLTLTDKRTARAYSRLLTFEDSADIGDGWYHGVAVNDQRFSSAGVACDVALLHDGPLLAQFRIRTALRLPAEFDFNAMRRAETWATVTIDSTVTLRAGSDHVEVHTEVDNQVKDHRLRVLLPSGCGAAQTYLADGAFDVLERSIALPADHHLGRELAVETTPQQTWTAVTADGTGLAVVAIGLHESAVLDRPERPIALTLFRCTRRTVFTDGEPDGQLQGKLAFDTLLVPLVGAVDRRRLCEAALLLAPTARTVQLHGQDLRRLRAGKAATLPAVGSLVRIEGAAVLTSARVVGTAIEVRVFNPETTAGEAVVLLPAFAGRRVSVCRVNFESRPDTAPEAFTGALRVRLRAKEIASFSFHVTSP